MWIFFGSDEMDAGAGAAGGGPPGEAAAGKPATAAGAAGAALCPGEIGMVETTRGAFGGSIFTGCSSCETRFSVEPVLAAPV